MKLSYKQKFVFLTITYGLILISISAISNFFISENNLDRVSKEYMKDKILEEEEYLKNFISNAGNILISISENMGFTNFIESNRKNNIYLAYVQELFVSMIKIRNDIMQLRYIDINGDEIIRVDKKNNQIFLINDNKLQNKASRDYFQDSIKLKESEFYTSKIDLNMEYGKIEVPIKPTIRLAMGIFDKNSNKKGILVINFCLKELIKKLKNLTLYNFFMIEDGGEFLIHPDSNKSWSRQLQKNFKLKDEFGKISNKILNSKEFVSENLIAKKINFFGHQDIRIILNIKFEKLNEKIKNKKFYTILVMLLVVLISLPFIYFLSLLPEKLMKRLSNNLNFQEELFKTIPIPIFVKDNRGHFTNCNEAFCEFLNTKKRFIIGKKISDFTVTEYAECQNNIDKKLISSSGFISDEQEFIYKNGDKKTIILHKTALIQNFLVTGIIGSIVDITDRKKFEEKLKETKQKITDSIKFSAMIQKSILPLHNPIKKFLEDYFIIWKPKDIVGGDIYLFEEFEDGCLICVIDCTGHGVPGAFMTMVTKTALNSIIDKTTHFNPSMILEKLNLSIKNILRQDRENSLSDVGLDGGILFYDKRNLKVTFAGAKIPLFFIQNDELKVIKGDRVSIGYKDSKHNFKFNNTTIDINSDAYFYITTDGLIDQNGGEKDFPFGKNRLKEILIKNYKLPFEKQKELICSKLKEYQGNSERNDDVTMFGFKIKWRKDERFI